MNGGTAAGGISLVPAAICGDGHGVLDFTFNPVALMGGLLFSVIGMFAFYYGKKNSYWQPMVMGLVLMFYPYFIYETWQVYTVGVALTIGLFVFRGED